jgi:hypothetical protein
MARQRKPSVEIEETGLINLEPLQILIERLLGIPHHSAKVDLILPGGGTASIEEAGFLIQLFKYKKSGLNPKSGGLLSLFDGVDSKSAGGFQASHLPDPFHGRKLYWLVASNGYNRLAKSSEAAQFLHILAYNLLEKWGLNGEPQTRHSGLLAPIKNCTSLHFLLAQIGLTGKRPLLDRHRLEEALRTIAPDAQAILDHRAEFHLNLTHATTGEPIRKDMKKLIRQGMDTFFNAMLASCHIPGAGERTPIVVDGVPCLDGGLSTTYLGGVMKDNRCTHALLPMNTTLDDNMILKGRPRKVVLGYAKEHNPKAEESYATLERRIVQELNEIKQTGYATDPTTKHSVAVLLSHPAKGQKTESRINVDPATLWRLYLRGAKRAKKLLAAAEATVQEGRFRHPGWRPVTSSTFQQAGL